ncbi:2-oxoglutarate dehydrogenase E1 component [Paracrocinitomix mangrovi]|uniref:2-oxoglutarate dehydrogenase E1 component n=1 Tax=Paracrocinitomix mangrovi TaxID=2862509 RepID=UPI001C8DA978|nr:2-oxoglutarate dehydrogenase E1 component [Paracrocinitomix mangrovi]UKN00833.1 2-oxoglutarate dehydrogenase E1 component [Paracrocinitomix mangrovi]
MDKFTYIGNSDVNAIDDLYQRYVENPESVDIQWARFFEGVDFAKTDFESGGIPENFQKEFKVINLINGYRSRGHLFTKTNPVRERRKYSPTLDIENFGLEQSDMQTVFQAGTEVGIGPATLKEIIDHLELTYCQSIGIEFAYMREPERYNWFKEHIELKNRPKFTAEEKKHIFKKISSATLFEHFLAKKYVGQKRFSIEGGEALIPALDVVIQKAAELGVKEVVMGMAHRGRLSTLVNIFGKDHASIFNEFDGKQFDTDDSFDGDVKYHLGYSTDVQTLSGNEVHLTLAPNPSHLEAVDPVVQGIARAKIDEYLKDETKIIPVAVHGDAAVAGQGIVYEVVQMAQLDGYRTGGTIHIVVNNQVGFTTNYLDARSSTYCTDVGKTTLCPVFHVNADDVEAVVQTLSIAVSYRQKFGRDVFIDLLGYRKYGHNEGDEPKFTQPKLYKAIAKHANPREIYLKQLIEEGVMSPAEGQKDEDEQMSLLDKSYEASKKQDKATVLNFLEVTWKGYRHGKLEDFEKSPSTSVSKAKILDLGKKLATLPSDLKYFRKITKLLNDRLEMLESNKLDWGMAEMLAYATLLDEGHPVRVSGQDVERGTFSHRHAVVKTEDDEQEIITLNLLNDKQAKFSIYNSLLSEYGVLGFEYGYSLATPTGLTIWEAQFGDFYNGAQIMVDQFISSGEDKWFVQSGLVMLLPHGYEGMGGEHSSARIERFLQQCADLNWQICNPTTPANHFHLLRRQLHREFRKPLVVFSPKMLLRYPKAVSTVEDLATGSFQEILDDDVTKSKVDTVVLVSGKFYYEAKEEAENRGVTNAAFIRIEQMYPFPHQQLNELLKKYKNAKNIFWAQEEPENMGPWRYMAMELRHLNLDVVSRPSSAAPAAGSSDLHKKRLGDLFNKLFNKIAGK